MDDDEESLIRIYADAQAALERLEERLRLSPVRGPFLTRMTLHERHALAAVDGTFIPDHAILINGRGRVSTTRHDLTRCKEAVGQSIALKNMMDDAARLLSWFGAGKTDDANTTAHDLSEIIWRIERWQQLCNDLPPSPALLRSARISMMWRQLQPLGRGDTVASLLIGDRWGPGRWKGSQGGLIAVGLQQSRSNWKRLSGQSLDRAWLTAIQNGARAHLTVELRLRAYAARARPKIERRRRPGHLKALLLHAMARPYVTSSEISQAFKLTSAGAIKLLSIAEGEGLLIERTGQASYRSYMIPVAGAMALHDPQSPERDPFEQSFWDQDA